MMHGAADALQVFIAMLCSGVFWTTAWFTLDRRPTWPFWPPLAAVIMVLSVYLFSSVIAPAAVPELAARP